MRWLDATDRMDELASLNASRTDIAVNAVDGPGGLKLVAADAVADLDGYLSHWAAWYRSLPETDAQPLPPPAVE